MAVLVAVGLALAGPVTGQSAHAPTRADLLAIARDVVASVPIPVLATVDDEGRPAVRPMDAHPPDEDWVVWMATNPNSRKVGHVRPRVALHYLWTRPPRPT